MEKEYKDSFTMGTPSSGGAIKVYFDETNAIDKITLAKKLYYEFVEKNKINKALNK